MDEEDVEVAEEGAEGAQEDEEVAACKALLTQVSCTIMHWHCSPAVHWP